MSAGQRILSIDFLKGIAIVLVILGHSVQVLTADPFNDRLFNLIYSFHMPLFMFVSGLVSYKEKTRYIDVIKRFYQLIIPFFLWPLFVGLLLKGSFDINVWKSIIEQPDKGLWFLWVLFFISSFFTVINSLNIPKISCLIQSGGGKLQILYILVCGILFSLILKIVPSNKYGADLISNYTLFYMVGMIVRKELNSVNRVMINFRWIFVFLFIVLSMFWKFNHHPSFIPTPNKLLSVAYYYTTAFMGIAFVCSFCFKYITQDKNTTFVRVFGYMGKVTLGLYAIHTQLALGLIYIHFINCNRSYAIILTLLLTLMVSIAIEFIIGKFILLPKLLLGKVLINTYK